MNNNNDNIFIFVENQPFMEIKEELILQMWCLLTER